jgi:hypothetical protein
MGAIPIPSILLLLSKPGLPGFDVFYIIMIVVDGTGLLPDLDKKILEVGLTLESLCGKIGA